MPVPESKRLAEVDFPIAVVSKHSAREKDARRAYPLLFVDGVIGPQEYCHNKECIKLKRCRIMKAGASGASLKGVVVRPSGHENPNAPRYWNRLEIMSRHHLTTKLGLASDDYIKVEVEKDYGQDSVWWQVPEPVEEQ